MIGRYVIALEGPLASTAGSELEAYTPIGEARPMALETILGLVEEEYKVVILTWRDAGEVNDWLSRLKLDWLASHDSFEITNEFPRGVPLAYIMTGDQMDALTSKRNRHHGR